MRWPRPQRMSSICLSRVVAQSVGLVSLLWGSGILPAVAQPALPLETGGQEEILQRPIQTPEVPELPSSFPPAELPEEEIPSLELPPAEATPNLPPAVAADQFLVGEIVLLGISVNPERLTVMIDGETVSVSELVAALEGQTASLEDLLQLRTQITEAYIGAGYITSGAFIPEQDFVDGGTISLQMVEGGLEAVEIEGLSRLQEKYVRDRIRVRTPRPLRQTDIENALKLLQRDPLIETVNAQLLAGSGAGQSILLLEVEEAPPLSVGVSVNNYRSPIVGSGQLNPYVGYTNLLGLGDRLDVSYTLTEGLNSYSLRYAVPVNANDGTVTLSVASGRNEIVESEFEALDIEGNSSSYSLGFRQPLVRSPNSEFALGLSFDLLRSRSSVFGDEPLSRSNVSALRFSQDWVDRTPSRVLAARSQFSLGLDVFDATRSDTVPDGRFLSWQGQFQWVQQLPKNQLLITRFSSQLTPDSLLSLEQFSLGGINTVRGYRDTQFLRDNGFASSVELRLPLTNPPEVLQLTPFLEGGLGWNTGEEDSLEGLASVGLGLLWKIDARTRLRLDYGYPLTDVNGDGNSLQENGFNFSLDWAL